MLWLALVSLCFVHVEVPGFGKDENLQGQLIVMFFSSLQQEKFPPITDTGSLAAQINDY